MADIRIKDFTTTDSTTRTGDFLPIDGATGTRKLSAFSPTFGGNATVTGTLTVNGTGNSSFAGQLIQVADPATISLWKDATPTKAARFQFNTLADNGFSLGVYDGSSWFNAITVAPTTGVVKVPSTSASTTTSSGALVVGNGTSGGLGVGGAINAGSYLRSINSAAANDTEFTALRADVGADGTLGAATVAIGSLPSATGTSRYGFITCSDNVDWRKLYIGGRPGLAVSGGQVLIPCTTASTSTSSGALVVSGGVGVAGNLSIGGNVLIDKSAIEVLLKRSADTNDGLIKFQTGIFGDFGIGHRGTSDSDLHIYNYGTAADALKIAKNDSLATFAAAIRTAAPSGGTAANWKLGTVATVSPTSPNRTIEVDIGGTIYYIHAKTTNN